MPQPDIQLFAATDVGRRRHHNEDSYLVDRDLGLCIVADGMGGHAAGEIASAAAVETIYEELTRNRDVLRDRSERGRASGVSAKQLLTLIEAATQTASARIHAIAQADPDKLGMGTTLSLLLVLDSLGFVAHVGDSRIYLERHGTLRQLTEDHTMAAEMLRHGMITEDRLDLVPHRNAITRAVGIYPHVKVDTFTFELLPGDQFIIASDGLTGYLKDDDTLLAMLGPDGDKTVQALVRHANRCGGKDNITVCLLRIGRPETDDGTRARRLAQKREMLSRIPLFCRLDERELERFSYVVRVVEHPSGDVIVREGDPGDQLFVVLSGRLSIMRGQSVVGSLGPGEPMGEMALIRTTPRSATVTAVEASELLALHRRDFFEVIRTEPQIAAKMLWQFVLVLADRLDSTSAELSMARNALAAGAAEADPFSVPAPSPLGRFRLGDDAPATVPIPPTHDSAPPSRPPPSRPPPSRPPPARTSSRPPPPPRRRRTRTKPSAGQQRSQVSAPVEDALEDMRATLPFIRAHTVPTASEPQARGQVDSLRKEIDELRKEFKERLLKSRKAAKKDESD